MTFKIGFAVLLSVFVATSIVYADCHDTASCEDVEQYVKGWLYWPPIVRHSISFRVDPNHPGKPSLLADVKNAAKSWSRIPYKGGKIDISFSYNDTPTTKDAGVEDDVSVISWE